MRSCFYRRICWLDIRLVIICITWIGGSSGGWDCGNWGVCLWGRRRGVLSRGLRVPGRCLCLWWSGSRGSRRVSIRLISNIYFNNKSTVEDESEHELDLLKGLSFAPYVQEAEGESFGHQYFVHEIRGDYQAQCVEEDQVEEVRVPVQREQFLQFGQSEVHEHHLEQEVKAEFTKDAETGQESPYLLLFLF